MIKFVHPPQYNIQTVNFIPHDRDHLTQPPTTSPHIKPKNLPQRRIRDIKIASLRIRCEILHANPHTLRLLEIHLHRRIPRLRRIARARQYRLASVEVRVSVVKREHAIWPEFGRIEDCGETFVELFDAGGFVEGAVEVGDVAVGAAEVAVGLGRVWVGHGVVFGEVVAEPVHCTHPAVCAV